MSVQRATFGRVGTVVSGIALKNPVFAAAGTAGFGESVPYDLSLLGGIMTKGTSPDPWRGNPLPRVAEVPAGMLNAIGLENPGMERVAAELLPGLARHDLAVVVNVVGRTLDEYRRVVAYLSPCPRVDAFEINVSCPNVSEGGLAFGRDPAAAAAVVAACRDVTAKPLWVKLTPNTLDPVAVAEGVVRAGADAVTLINTVLGMRIDPRTRRPVLAAGVGGLSGPAVRPVAVRMVYEVARAVDVPVIGMGGIVTAEDALEFILAGARAVAVGTANLVDPWAAVKVAQGLEAFARREGLDSLDALVGAAGSRRP